MKITIESTPHKLQRYPTVGDWYRDANGDLVIKVSQMSDWRFMALVALHELVEVLLCDHRGIRQETVDKFDIEFEAHRHPDNFDEPGDDPQAPYKKEHCFATGVERLLAAELGVDWSTYADEIDSLP